VVCVTAAPAPYYFALAHLTPARLARFLAYRTAEAARLAGAGPSPRLDTVRETVEALTAELDRRGRCRRCGRELRVEASVSAGIGPDCKNRVDNGR